MDLRLTSFTFTVFMALLSKNVEKDNRKEPLQIKPLKKQRTHKPEKNSEMYHLTDGLSPHSVLSSISGSLSPRTLIFLVLCLLTQTCEGDEVDLSDLPYLKNDAASNAGSSTPQISMSRGHFVATLIGVAVFGFGLCAAWCACKKKCAGAARDIESPEDPPPPPPPETEGLHKQCTIEVEQDIVGVLENRRTETEKRRDELRSELDEVRREKEENSKKLQEVQTELKNVGGDKKQALFSDRDQLLDVEWKLDYTETEKEKVLIETKRHLQTIETVTSKIKQSV